jgi:hypothetical protein
MRRSVIAALIVAGVTAIGLGAGWYYYVGTPDYSLTQLAKAVKGKDYETARYFVDEERIADSSSQAIVGILITRSTKTLEADKNPFSGLGVAMMQMMVPRLREVTKDQLKESIKQALRGHDTLTNKEGTKRADLKPFSNLQIRQCVSSGNTAEVLVSGLPQPNRFELKEIRLRMARIPNWRSWRIVEEPDVAQVFAKLLNESESQPSR